MMQRMGGTIYLDARLLEKPALLQDVFNEELGHHLDSVLGGNNARGDEGAVFSQSLRSGLLDQKTLQQLQVEQDHGYIDVDGEQVAVDFRSAQEGSGNGQSPSPSPSPSSSTSTGGYDEVGINVPAPPEDPPQNVYKESSFYINPRSANDVCTPCPIIRWSKTLY